MKNLIRLFLTSLLQVLPLGRTLHVPKTVIVPSPDVHDQLYALQDAGSVRNDFTK